ncbi:MAG: hypothetical protein JWR08_1433 [Enterovirga sp.]|jgi:outer membrane protein OmpA-like peptidoglycan-associated protein|nr:hypothetical protein [Enterovirga sp.]
MLLRSAVLEGVVESWDREGAVFNRLFVGMCAAAALCAAAAPALSAPAKKSPAGQAAAPQYTAEEVVKAFSGPPVNQGGSRGVCIGSESECSLRKGQPAAAAVSATPQFDLLITFEYNSDELTRSARRNLDEFAKALKTPGLAQSRFVLEGHTDAVGNPEYNLDLSRRRASAALRYLASRGVSEASLAAEGYGETKPRVPDPLDPANRRVEARLAN